MICEGCTDQKEFNELKEEVHKLREQVKNIDNIYFKQSIRLSEIEDRNKYIFLNPSSKSYQKLDSDGNVFFISCEDIRPYAGGYKLTLSIGNPYVVFFNGFTLSIEWGKKYDPDNDNYIEWEKSLKKKRSRFLIP